MNILRLSDVEAPMSFDCGDCDLNEFLLNDANLYEEEFLAHTYVIVNEDEIVAYFSILADKVSKSLVSKNVWRKLGKKIPHEKHFNSYPALKIARLAVSKKYRGQEIGTNIIQSIAHRSAQKAEFMACRFLTVDAYKSAIEFYEKNDFVPLINVVDPELSTVPMYMDLKSLFE